SGAKGSLNHLGVLHLLMYLISCSLYGDDDTWEAWHNFTFL
ncbi:unnamed protein product, partial [Brassica oleracea]